MHGLTTLVSGLFRREEPRSPRLNTVLHQYQRLAASDPDTIAKNVRVFTLFVRHAGNIHCRDVTKLMVTQFQATLRECGKATATIRSYCGSVSSVFGWAVETGLIEVNPFKGVKRPKLAKPRPTFWSRDEMRRLHDAIDKLHWRDPVRALQWHGMIQLADDCGLRIGELLNLRWIDIDLDPQRGRAILYVRQREDASGQWWSWTTKGRRDRLSPIPLPSMELLERMRVSCPWMYPFLPRERCLSLQAHVGQLAIGVRKRPYTGLYQIWNRIKGAANVEGDGAFHRIRRTAATESAEHLTLAQLKEQFGWEDNSTAQRYVAVREEAQMEAVARAQAARNAGAWT